jgi:hypothetical protein
MIDDNHDLIDRRARRMKSSLNTNSRLAAKGKNAAEVRTRVLVDHEIYQALHDAAPLVSRRRIQKLEQTAELRDWVRRAMWLVLAMPGKELIDKVAADRQAAVAWAHLSDASAEYRNSVCRILEFVEVMQARLLVALATREDMDQLFAEVRRSKAKTRG